MEHKGPGSTNSDQLDLAQFFGSIRRGFQRFGDNILYLLAFTRHVFVSNLKFFTIIIILGLGLGYAYFKILNKEYYRTSMVLKCVYINNQIMTNMIDELNLLCSEGDRKGLARELQIPDSLALQILGFEYEPFITEKEIVQIESLKEQLNNVAQDKREAVDKLIGRLEVENKDVYKITVFIAQPTVVKSLEEAMFNFFRNNTYIKKRLDATQNMRLERKLKLLQESRKIDSLKRILFANMEKLPRENRGSNNVILNDENPHNPLEYITQDLNLNSQLLQLESDIAINPDFELVDGFTGVNRPESVTLPVALTISLFLAVFIGYLIIFVQRFDQMLSKIPITQ